jgi:hypothetical protein
MSFLNSYGNLKTRKIARAKKLKLKVLRLNIQATKA